MIRTVGELEMVFLAAKVQKAEEDGAEKACFSEGMLREVILRG